ncbi:putative baseplate assembly protein [Nodosilinea sp. P-1105]|uniref:putative baseplate assembly protein n=1 Tax=Nodosilinea sp. P-1105 TaxID=2546229 RepID=UPI00146C9D17|nr:putative baseplate assembly protein [Nodosilinea sp. P-1105]NMF85088.1 putative baseplate assembly protein [Nodosilinea sp. P-1105]
MTRDRTTHNRPGLSQLSYRIGDYHSFRQRLLAALPQALKTVEREAPLAKLTTRDSSDPAIALLDAWAVVADVLTFYQERIANEGFLRTATERRSVLELARAIAYELDPGVAASTYLSFVVEDAPGSPTVVPIPAYTQIMSVPVKDELPQIFETTADFTARLAWNNLRPRPARPQQVLPHTRQLYLEGASTQLQPGELLLLVDRGPDPQAFLLPLQAVEPDTSAGYTRVRWHQSLPPITTPLRRPQVLAFRQQARLFGFNAPPWEQMPAAIKLAAVEKSGGAIAGGVFRSDSDGLTWTAASQGLPDQDVTCLATKYGPDGEIIIFAGTPEKGIFRSKDNGQSWQAVNSGLTNQRIQTLHVDSEGDPIYAGTPNGGVFRSKDDGENWVAINIGKISSRKVEPTPADETELWEPVNTSIPDTVVRSLLTYSITTHQGLGAISNSGKTITGLGTAFKADISVGDYISPARSGAGAVEVDDVTNDFELKVKKAIKFLPGGTSYSAKASVISTLTIEDLLSIAAAASSEDVVSVDRSVGSLIRSLIQLTGPIKETAQTLFSPTISVLLENSYSFEEAQGIAGVEDFIQDLQERVSNLIFLDLEPMAKFTTHVELQESNTLAINITPDEINLPREILPDDGNGWFDLKISGSPVVLFPWLEIEADGTVVKIPQCKQIKDILNSFSLFPNTAVDLEEMNTGLELVIQVGESSEARSMGRTDDDNSSVEFDPPFDIRIPDSRSDAEPVSLTINHTIQSNFSINGMEITVTERTTLTQPLPSFTTLSLLEVPVAEISPLIAQTKIRKFIESIAIDGIDLEDLGTLNPLISRESQVGTIKAVGKTVIGKGSKFTDLLPDNIIYTWPSIDRGSWSATLKANVEQEIEKKVVSVEDDFELTLESAFSKEISSPVSYYVFANDNRDKKLFRRKHIFAGTDDGLYFSRDYAQSWHVLGSEGDVRNKVIFSLAYSTKLIENPPGEYDYYVFAGTEAGAYYSKFDLINTFSHASPWRQLPLIREGLSDSSSVFSLLANGDSQDDGAYVWVGTNVGLYFLSSLYFDFESEDLSADFDIGFPDENAVIYSLAASKRRNAVYVFAATNHGLYRTVVESSDEDPVNWADASGNWSKQQKGAIVSLRVITVEADDQANIYVGSQFVGFFVTEETDSGAGNTADEPNSGLTNDHELATPVLQKLEWPNFVIQEPRRMDLDTLYPQWLEGSWVVLVDDRNPNNPEQRAEPRYAVRQIEAIATVDRQDFGLAGKLTRLAVTPALDPAAFGLRSARVLGRSTELPLALEPLTVEERQHEIFADPLVENTLYLQDFVANLQPKQVVMVSGQPMGMGLSDVGGVLRSRHHWQPRNTGLNNLTINALANIQEDLLAATNEGLYRSFDGTTWESVSPLRFKAVHSIFSEPNLLLVGADLDLYRAELPGGNLVKVTLPTGVTVLSFTACTVDAEAPINISNISGITIRTADAIQPEDLPVGTVITATVEAPPADEEENSENQSVSQTRIVIQEPSQQTFLINEIFALNQFPNQAMPTTFNIGGTVWLAGTDRGFLRSTDSGTTWEYLKDHQDRQIYCLFSRKSQSIIEIFAGTDQGLYYSQDSGQSWNLLAALWEQQIHPAVYALAERDNVVFVGTGRGIFQVTGEEIQKLDGLCDRAILSLTIEDGILYAGTDQGIYRSPDQGETWDALDPGLAPVTGRVLLSLPHLPHSSTPHLLVGTEAGLFATPTAGQRLQPTNWSRSNTGLVNSQVTTLASSADGTTLLAGTLAGLYRSASGGRTWVPFDDGLDQPNGPDRLPIQAILRTEGGHWLVGTPAGLFVHGPVADDPDGGTAWQVVGRDTLTYPNILALALQGSWLLAGTVNGGLFKLNLTSLNFDGPQGQPIAQRWQPTGLNNTDVDAIAVVDEGIYAGTIGDGIFRSTDQGNTWEQITQTRQGRGTLASDGTQVTWSGTQFGGMLRSGDVITAAGQTRTITSSNPIALDVPFTVDAPFRPDLSPNTRFTIATGLTNLEITALAYQEAGGTLTLYAGTAGSGMFRSKDGGDRWQPVIANLDDLNIRCLLYEDMDEDPGTLWAGTATRGVFRSINQGDLWTSASLNLTNTDVRALLRPSQSTLLVGGIGFLRSTDELTVKPVQRHDRMQVVQAPQPIAAQPDSEQRWQLRDKDGFLGSLDTTAEQIFPLLPAEEDAPLVSEQAQIKHPPTEQQQPVVILQAPLTYSYDPITVTVAANVVPATHGETALEVLGSGDGTTSNPTFVLKKPPLTYVAATNARGSDSTLEVRVDGVLWQEVSALYSLQPQAQAYIIRIQDDGTTTVTFGDGVRGSRPPSGQENITARYRSGIGREGNVQAGQLSILKTRPQGIAEVINPLAASGAADRESLDAARTNAPPTARTLGRIVSLQDFQDFAQGFVGIAKAQAVALWDGSAPVVHITIAGADGDPVPETSALYQSLLAAIDQARDPTQQVQVASYQRLFFNVEARVLLDTRYLVEAVEPQMIQRLVDRFAFQGRGFGQAVTSAEVITALQSVEGVIAVDLEALYRVGRSRTLNVSLDARTAVYDPDTETIQPAQLFLLSPVGLQFSVVSTL